MENQKRPVDVLIQEQRELHETVKQALENFSNRTGIAVDRISFQTHIVRESDGQVMGIAYTGITSDISTGV